MYLASTGEIFNAWKQQFPQKTTDNFNIALQDNFLPLKDYYPWIPPN